DDLPEAGPALPEAQAEPLALLGEDLGDRRRRRPEHGEGPRRGHVPELDRRLAAETEKRDRLARAGEAPPGGLTTRDAERRNRRQGGRVPDGHALASVADRHELLRPGCERQPHWVDPLRLQLLAERAGEGVPDLDRFVRGGDQQAGVVEEGELPDRAIVPGGPGARVLLLGTP